MRSSTSITLALVGITTAFTPVGFQPASTNNLTVAFGNTLAVNGVNLPKAETQTAPTIGTSQPLVGSYTLMMVDPDIPPQTAGGATSELLHWMQPGSTATAAAGAGADVNSTGAAKSTAGVGAKRTGSGAILAGLGAMAAAVILL
ncbi:hypothetical protein LAWI1_G002291 [Lachnellula willkommii]|uniref:Uncharacterized protein n=1 Tax=Lachnellula willkommii TaxID=215461 RepID=A0A559ME22_9HELO|nr:hypothetical protein LAWI1_G002291 [Lachnellula willkommii]